MNLLELADDRAGVQTNEESERIFSFIWLRVVSSASNVDEDVESAMTLLVQITGDLCFWSFYRIP